MNFYYDTSFVLCVIIENTEMTWPKSAFFPIASFIMHIVLIHNKYAQYVIVFPPMITYQIAYFITEAFCPIFPLPPFLIIAILQNAYVFFSPKYVQVEYITAHHAFCSAWAYVEVKVLVLDQR